MKRLNAIFCLLFYANSLHAACALASAGIWHCPDTGDPYTNGSDLRNFFLNKPFSCGDKIVLYAGVTYRAADGFIDPYLPLKPQVGCGDRKTEIVSSAIAEIPFNAKQTLVNHRSEMPSLEVSSNAIFHLWDSGGSNNYKFSGLRLATWKYAVENRFKVSTLFAQSTFNFDSDVNISCCTPHDIEIDRCLFEEYEEQAFGDPNTSQTNGNSFLRAVPIAIGGYPMKNWFIHDSHIKLAGYTNSGAEPGTTDWLNITTGTNSNPAVLQGTNLTTALGLTYSSSCTSACIGWTEGGPCGGVCKRVVVRGASGSWATLNGPRYVRARADGNVEVINPSPDHGASSGTTYFDSTGLGAFTATSPQMSGVALLTQYAFYFSVVENMRIIDNYMEAWAMPIFAGGSDGPRIDPATIQSGSTSTAVIVSHTRGLSVGMLLAFNVPPGSGKSTYCHGAGTVGCLFNDINRTGRVTAIAGNTVTVEPWGPDGTDGKTPQTGGQAWWRNHEVKGIEVRGNAISRGYLHPNGDAGKGVIELKHCAYCSFEGNVMGGYLDASNIPKTNMGGSYFIHASSQGGTDPNYVPNHVTFSNNIAIGQLPSGAATCLWRTNIQGVDTEHSAAQVSDAVFEHNVHIGCVSPIGNYSFPEMFGNRNSSYRHNTYAPTMAQANSYRFVVAQDCLPNGDPFFPEYYRSTNSPVKDNIIGYGYGAYLGAPNGATCWPTYQTDIVRNVIIDTQSIGTGVINTTFPNNFPVADYTNFWAGTCAYDTWTNCRMNAANPNRGAASDGGDPGADIEQVQDRINRWSERAGLLQMDYGSTSMRNNRGAWNVGSTLSSMRFTLFNSPPSACTVELFTNRNRATGHPDTNTSGRKGCDRTGNLVEGNTVTFLFGTQSALAASTTYFYRITDGTRVMVGEFRTLAAGTGTSLWPLQLPSASTVSYASAADFNGAVTLPSSTRHAIPVASGSVVYWRVDSLGKKAAFIAP